MIKFQCKNAVVLLGLCFLAACNQATFSELSQSSSKFFDSISIKPGFSTTKEVTNVVPLTEVLKASPLL